MMNEQANQSMQAVVCHGPENYLLEQVPKPEAAVNELVMRIAACGICASDCKCHSGAAMFWGGESPWVKAPVIPGHEFFGYVEQVGPQAGEHFGVKVGDKIIAEQIVSCNKCRFCKTGKYWMCEVHNIFGFQRVVADGGMAEYMRVPPTAIVHAIPEAVSFNDSALIEPMACAIHAVERGDVQLSDVVVIAGAGTLGLCMVQIARLKSPKKLVVIDMLEDRLELARSLGADVTLNPAKVDVKAAINALTDGYGCDVYIETTGVPVGVTQGLDLIRKLGRFVEFSVFGKPSSVDWSVIGDRKELDIRGAHLGPYCYPVAIDLFERGLITSKGIVTHDFHLDDFKKAFALADSTSSIKVLLKPWR